MRGGRREMERGNLYTIRGKGYKKKRGLDVDYIFILLR